jgi:hypothetical protein
VGAVGAGALFFRVLYFSCFPLIVATVLYLCVLVFYMVCAQSYVFPVIYDVHHSLAPHRATAWADTAAVAATAASVLRLRRRCMTARRRRFSCDAASSRDGVGRHGRRRCDRGVRPPTRRRCLSVRRRRLFSFALHA